MTGISGRFSRQWRNRARPSVFGIRMSETRASARLAESQPIAAAPSGASATSYPSRTSIALTTRLRLRSSSATRTFPFIASSLRQLHREPAPLAGHAPDGDRAAVFLHDPLADREPHPDAALTG